MTSLASVFVEVRPDTSGFSSELKTSLAKTREAVDVAASLDTRKLKPQLDALKADLRAIQLTKATITADTAQANAKLRELKLELKGLNEKVKLGTDDSGVKERIAAVKAEIASIGNGKAKLSVDSGAASAHIKALSAQLAIFDRDRTVKVNVEGQKGINFAFRGVSNLATAIAGLAPIAVPAFAAVAAGAGIAGSALLTAAGAGGVFGLAIAGQVKGMKDAQTAMGTTNKAVGAARTAEDGYRIALKGTTKGSAEYKTALKQLQAAHAKTAEQQRRATVEQKNFNQQFGPAAKGLDNVKGAFQRFLKGTRSTTVDAMGHALNIVAGILPRLVPLANSAGAAVSGLLDDVARFVHSSQFQHILDFFQKNGPGAITVFGEVAGRTLLGVFHLFEAFTPYQRSFLGGIEKMSSAFLGWSSGFGKSNGFSKFMGYAKSVLPQVVDLFVSLSTFAGKFVVALGPLAGIELKGVLALLHGLNSLPPKVLTAIAFGITGIVLGLKAWEIGTKAVTIVTKIWAAAQWVLNAALEANPIGLVVIGLVALGAGLVLAYKKSKTFRDIVNGAWRGVKDVAAAVVGWFANSFVPFFTKTIPNAFHATVNWVKRNWPWILGALTGPIGLATVFIAKHWDKITGAFKSAKNWVLGAFKRSWSALSGMLLAPIITVRDKIANIFGSGGPVRTAFSHAVSAIGSIWSGLRRVAAAPVNFIIGTVYNNGIRAALNKLPLVNLSKAKLIPGFDVGGYTGAGGKFEPAGIVHRGEHVIRKESRDSVESRAPGFLDHLNRRGAKALEGMVPGFMTGGAVGGGPMLNWAAAARFARSQVGKPYVWGGVGPGGYDCSGFMSAITNVLRGNGPHSRVGSTASFPWPGFVPGPGEFTIGSTNRYPGSSVGHMAGTLRGMNVESRGGTGVITGPRARGYNDPGFNKHYHIGAGGNFGHGGGGGGFMSNPLSGLNVAGWVKHLKGMGGYGPELAGIPGHLVSGLAGFVKKKLKAAIGVIGDATGAIGRGLGGGAGRSAPGGNIGKELGIMARAYGWTGRELSSLNNIVRSESGFNPHAQNPTSTAYGLFQFLNSTWATVGARKTSDPTAQIGAGLRYIKQRYGDPNRAWSYHLAHGSYDQGGLARGIGYMEKRTIKPERVLSPQTTESFDRLVALLERGGVGGSSAPFIGSAVIRENVDLEKYERQRAFRERRATV